MKIKNNVSPIRYKESALPVFESFGFILGNFLKKLSQMNHNSIA